MRVKQYLCFNNYGMWSKYLIPVKCIYPPLTNAVACFPFLGVGFVVKSLFIFDHIMAVLCLFHFCCASICANHLNGTERAVSNRYLTL